MSVLAMCLKRISTVVHILQKSLRLIIDLQTSYTESPEGTCISMSIFLNEFLQKIDNIQKYIWIIKSLHTIIFCENVDINKFNANRLDLFRLIMKLHYSGFLNSNDKRNKTEKANYK